MKVILKQYERIIISNIDGSEVIELVLVDEEILPIWRTSKKGGLN